MSQFQIVIIGILMALALVAVLMLGGVIPGFGLGQQSGKAVDLVIWGTTPYDHLKSLISDLNENNKNLFSLGYIQKNPVTYENELIDALASGAGPDIFFLSQDLILKHKDKVFILPFESFSKRAFKDIFIEEGELYLTDKGIIAFPFLIDPMVLYWNRDLFAAAGLSQPPKFWEEFVNFSQQLTIRDEAGNIKQSGASFGEFQNVDYAKNIISFLILQTGNPIVELETLHSTLAEKGTSPLPPAESAVRFFTGFSDPSKTSYSWNRSLPSSKNAFIAGILAMYFGYASEYNDIKEKNPHLNFDVAEVPQIKEGSIRATFGRIEALAVSKSSPKIQGAFTAIVKLTEKDSISKLIQKAFLPPIRRDLLSQFPEDPAFSIFYKAAIQSRAWLEPEPKDVSEMFKTMIESVLTGKKKISEAVRDTHLKLDAMLKNFQTK